MPPQKKAAKKAAPVVQRNNTPFYVSQICSLVKTALRCVVFCVLGFFGWQCIEALAGKKTDAQIDVAGAFDLRFFASRYAAHIVFGLLGVGGVGYGYSQRRLYRQSVLKLKRLEKYETQLDPNRSGSGLTDGWQANPEDPE